MESIFITLHLQNDIHHIWQVELRNYVWSNIYSHCDSGVQWNLSNVDTLGTEESVLISGVKLYTNMVFGIAKVSSFQGVLIRGVPL